MVFVLYYKIYSLLSQLYKLMPTEKELAKNQISSGMNLNYRIIENM